LIFENCKNARMRVFFMGKEIAPGFEGMRRPRHMPPVPNARLARFFKKIFFQNRVGE